MVGPVLIKNRGFKVFAVVFYYRRSESAPHSKFTIRSVFSTGGSFELAVTKMSL